MNKCMKTKLVARILTDMDAHVRSGQDKKTFFTNKGDFDTEYAEIKDWYKRLTGKEWRNGK